MPVSNYYISDDDHLKYEDDFCAKKYKSKILNKSEDFSCNCSNAVVLANAMVTNDDNLTKYDRQMVRRLTISTPKIG